MTPDCKKARWQMAQTICKVSLAIAFLLLASTPASASLIFDALVPVSGAGFGNIPRALTIQEVGPHKSGTESGCVGISGTGNIAIGASECQSGDAGFDPNGVINVGGDEPNPHTDFPKYSIPSAASLGINSADDIQIILDLTEPAGDSANVTDLTLKFYSGNMLVGSIDGGHNFPFSIPGNGQAGFAFVVSPDEWAYVNGLLMMGDIRFALESTITDIAGGPDSYFIRNGGGTVPEPAGLTLFGSALLVCAYRFRRRK